MEISLITHLPHLRLAEPLYLRKGQ